MLAVCGGLMPKHSMIRNILPPWTLEGKMMAMLKSGGVQPYKVALKYHDCVKLAAILSEIDFDRPVALLTAGKPLHWMGVGGYDMDKGLFYVFDSREHKNGKSSEDPHLPIGNRVISFEDLLSEWRGWLGWKYRAVFVRS